MALLLTILGRGRWLALVLGLYLVCESKLYAQLPPIGGPPKLRGPAMGAAMPLLPPKPPINLLNNGSLATWPNPNAILPNQHQFAYIAALPLGDRLGYNGIFYDQEIIPNVGIFTPGMGGGGAPMPGPGPFPGPFPPPFPPVKAAMLQRQRMMAIQAMQMRMMMTQAYMYQYQQQAYMQSFGGGQGAGDLAAPAFQTGMTTYGSTQAPMNNVGFGAGFRN